MMRALIVATALVAGFSLAVALRMRNEQEIYAAHFDSVMGAPLDLRVAAGSDAAARQAQGAVRTQIDRDWKILDNRDPDSELSRWLRSSDTPTRVSPALLDVLAAFDEWRGRTQGALDPAAGILRQVWQRAAGENRLPTKRELQTAVARIKERHWILDRASSTAIHTSSVPLALNAFARGYIFERAARAALAVPRVTGVLISGSGRSVIRGAWTQRVALAGSERGAALPTEVIVRDAAVAVRDAYRRGFEIAGRHYARQIDARTGRPSRNVLSAAVVSPDIITADALATAFCLLDPPDRAALAASVPDAQFLIVLDDGQRIESPGWRTFESHPFAGPQPGEAGDITLAALWPGQWLVARRIA